MGAAVTLNPVVVFLVYAGIGVLVYTLGSFFAPRRTDIGGKLAPYACGEDIPLQRVRPNYNFYHVAYLFTILHVGTLVTCTSFGITVFILPLLYLGLVTFCIVILIAR
jgi:NADH:ubiquinone oxidoreductase subunit 3 (subunit A)